MKFTTSSCRNYFAVVLLFLLFGNCFGQQQEKDILDKEIDLNVEESFLAICASLSFFEGIPVGLENNKIYNDIFQRNIAIKKGPLKHVLNSIVEQAPDYTWEIRDGVVNIYPKKFRDELLKSLLETSIEKFSSKKELGRRQIAGNIYKLDEINSFINLKQAQLGIMTRYNPHIPDETTDIDISQTNLRALLNQIIKESGDSKMWSISKSEDGRILLSF